MIELYNINKYYRMGRSSRKKSPKENKDQNRLTYHALKDINIKFGNKGMNFILGKSGSGKSTLLNIIGGIDSYDSGELLIDGVNTKNYTAKDYNTYRNTYIGFIFQEFNVLKGLNVYENVALSLDLKRVPTKEQKELIKDVIDRVGLTGLEDRMMNQISGGQRQRVAIARALVKSPRVIIADEPTGNLDSKNSKMVMDLLKDLSHDHLVIIVTHNDLLAHQYADRIISLKDGEIISDKNNITDDNAETYNLEPVKAPIKTSVSLALKSMFKNKIRFIFIILLFAVSLLFAGVVANLFLADTTKVYSEFQNKYNNNVLNIQKKYLNSGVTSSTAFYNFEVERQIKNYAANQPQLEIIKGMDYNIRIDQNATIEDDIYVNSIQRIHIYDSERDDYNLYIENRRNEYKSFDENKYIPVIITDYVADNLIWQNYFGSKVTSRADLLSGHNSIKVDGFIREFMIVNILKTDYEIFVENIDKDANFKAAFDDNLLYYNSIFLEENYYKKAYQAGKPDDGSGENYDNVEYVYDNLIYSLLKKTGVYENVKITSFDSVKDEARSSKGEEPKKPEEGKQIEIAVSTGFLQKVIGLEGGVDELYDIVNYQIEYLDTTGEKKYQIFNAVPMLTGVSRTPISLSGKITTIIENDEPIIYTPKKSESDLFSKYCANSYGSGAYLTLLLNNLDGTKDSTEANSKFYRELINNNINIKNITFNKVVLVEDFINTNLWLFIGVFFVFGLFSILLIFNFIIVNIKNSTRDIGIYMSLGMSGFKISLIYFFQVIIMGLVSFIIASIGTFIFLKVLDAKFTAMTMVNLEIINVSIFGVLIVLGIATIFPTLSVIFPLLNLNRKRPVDVIKSI